MDAGISAILVTRNEEKKSELPSDKRREERLKLGVNTSITRFDFPYDILNYDTGMYDRNLKSLAYVRVLDEKGSLNIFMVDNLDDEKRRVATATLLLPATTLTESGFTRIRKSNWSRKIFTCNTRFSARS